jgi:hypothetical protein
MKKPYYLRQYDSLNAARGILTGMMIGCALWAVVGLFIWLAFFGGE